jgi:SAM-dependent methyltransferase
VERGVESTGTIAAENEEARDAWNGVLFDRFSEFREIVISSLGAHGAEALRLNPPQSGERVLDVGCGYGDTTQQIARMVGDSGSAHGVDVAERFIETATAESVEAALENVSFEVCDVQTTEFPREYDYAFSRFGTMFFANPVAALRNVRNGLVPDGRLCMVVWRHKPDNEWLHRAELAVERFLPEPDHDATDEPTCGPGPFSMAGADVTSGILVAAGFEQISLRRCDIVVKIGDDLDRAVDLMMSIGPAGEIIRLSGDDAERIRPQLHAAISEALSDYVTPEGVFGSSSTWIVTARNPS